MVTLEQKQAANYANYRPVKNSSGITTGSTHIKSGSKGYISPNDFNADGTPKDKTKFTLQGSVKAGVVKEGKSEPEQIQPVQPNPSKPTSELNNPIVSTNPVEASPVYYQGATQEPAAAQTGNMLPLVLIGGALLLLGK